MSELVYNQVEQADSFLTISPTTRCLDEEKMIKGWAEEISEALISLDRGSVLIDFKNVYIMTSSALSKLLSFRAQLLEKKMTLALCGLSNGIATAFHITCLDKVFTIGKDREDALRLLSPAEAK